MAEIQGAVAAAHVKDDLMEAFREAVQTYGVTVALTAAVVFAATVVHDSEHMIDSPSSLRDEILGKWSSEFHKYLARLNQICDQGRADNAFRTMKPEGMA